MNKSLLDYFSVTGKDIPEIVDLRGLEAPEPMEKILMASAQLEKNGIYIAHLPHVPAPLFPHLDSRGLQWRVFEESDGSALVLIRRAT
jgi:hypothetical protein